MRMADLICVGAVLLAITVSGCCPPCNYTGQATAQPTAAQPGQTGQTGQIGQCSVIGQWRGIVPDGILTGRPIDLTFWEGGAARGIAGSITLDTAWTLQGNVVTITDVRASPAAAACPSSQVGRYSISFTPDCGTVQADAIEDPCAHRRMTLGGLRGSRVQ